MARPSSAFQVLIAEDEVLIRTLLEDALEDWGIRALALESAEAALALVERQPEDLHALITDIRLGPGMSGWELARRVRRLRPDLPVLYVTGDSAAEWLEERVEGGALLMKPFRNSELHVELRALLGAQSSSLRA